MWYRPYNVLHCDDCTMYYYNVNTVTVVLFVTPDSDSLTSCCAFDLLPVCSVIKLFIVVTRADHRLREVNEFLHVGHRVHCGHKS